MGWQKPPAVYLTRGRERPALKEEQPQVTAYTAFLISAKWAGLHCWCEGQQVVTVSWLGVADTSLTALKTDLTPLFHHMHPKYLTRPIWESENLDSTYNQEPMVQRSAYLCLCWVWDFCTQSDPGISLTWNPAKGRRSTECDFPERRKKPKIIKVFILERHHLNSEDSISSRTRLKHTLKR